MEIPSKRHNAPQATSRRSERSGASSAVVLPREIVFREPCELRPHPRNARKHPRRQIQKLAASIEAVGHLVPILIDENGFILKGHATVAAAKLLHLAKVPTVSVTGLTDAQKRLFMLADNRLAEDSGWDRQQLSSELGELVELLEPIDLDVTITGFEPAEIDMIFADHAAATADPGDELPPIPITPTARPGDLWSLGSHRIVCGDARSAEDLDALMGGARARMAFIDAPYNLEISRIQGRGRQQHPEFLLGSGEMSEDEFSAFLQSSFRNVACACRDGAIVFACMDWRHISPMLSAGGAAFAELKNLVVWNKSSPGQGNFYRSQHELIFVWKVGNGEHVNAFGLGQNGRMRSNVWTYVGMNSFRAGRADDLKMHPTVKPVQLVSDAIRDTSVKGDVVLDVFLGSGTTIMAAEKIGRRGFGLEYDPRYVDVAIRRWQKYAKGDAVLVGDGRTFDEVAAARAAEQEPIPAGQVIPTASDGAGVQNADCEAGDWVALSEGRLGAPSISERNP